MSDDRGTEQPGTTQRATARAVGVLFVLATVSAVIGGSLIAQIEEDGADLGGLRGQVSTGVLVEVVLALSVIAIAVLLVPLLRRQHEAAAIGYAALRTVEGAFVLLATTCAILVVSLGEDGSLDPGPMLDQLLAAREWTYFVGTLVVFGISAVVLNVLLYQSRLVPRWLSGWGLLGAVLLLVRGVLEVYGMESPLAIQLVWSAPIAIQEMVLAGWLIVRGFDTSHLARSPDPRLPASSPGRSGQAGESSGRSDP
jgi:hypothetical protein